MGRVLLEMLEAAARMLGMRWTIEQGWTPILITGGALLLGFFTVAWIVGRLTGPPAAYDGDNSVYVRGGCLTVLIGGGGLIFIAAVVWAWRYLFGGY